MKRPTSSFCCHAQHSQQGVTLIELIAVIVLLGIASSMIFVGLTAYRNIGLQKDTTYNAQLAQQRLELILAEKRANGFPPGNDADGPDPCELHQLNMPGCDEQVVVSFKDNNNNNCRESSFEYCIVSVTVGEQEFKLTLYNYNQ